MDRVLVKALGRTSLVWGKAERALQSGERKAGVGLVDRITDYNQCVQILQSRGKRSWSHALLSVCPVTGQETMHGQKLKLWMLSWNVKENIFYCVSDWTLVEVVQGGCDMSLFGHTQKPSGLILGKCLLGALFEQEVGSDELQRFLPASAILWFQEE